MKIQRGGARTGCAPVGKTETVTGSGAQGAASTRFRPGDIRREDWDRVGWKEIQWVRQVRDRGCILGIGFWQDRLVQFLGDEANSSGLARQVSPMESLWLLGNIAGLEMRDLPDIESNSVGWYRWLRLLRPF